MIVTCYYDIYNKPENFLKYLELFSPLANTGIPIILFTTADITVTFPNVRVISVPLETFDNNFDVIFRKQQLEVTEQEEEAWQELEDKSKKAEGKK